MNNVQHVFFDLDETLWDYERNALLALESLLKLYSFEIELDDFLKVYLPINTKYWDKYRAKEVNQFDLHRGRFVEVFDALKWELSEGDFEKFLEDYTVHLLRNNYLFPGVEDTLAYLSKSYKLHIITDGFSDLQDKKLKNANILHYFDTVTTSDIVGITKPYPEIYEKALEDADAGKAESLMVGDNLDFDVYGALDFGIKAIHFNPKGNSEFEGLTINSIEELKNIL